MKRFLRSPVPWVILALILVGLAVNYAGSATGGKLIPTSQIVTLINGDDKLKSVTLRDGEQEIEVVTATETTYGEAGTKLRAYWVGNQDDEIVKRLNERIADKTLDEWVGENPTPGFLSQMLPVLIPFLIIGVLFYFLLNSVQGGGNRVLQFGKSRAKIANKDTPKTTFADVAGCDEAIEELEEIKEFLAEPAKFQAVGAKIPKGVLLYGEPGTGKTLLARAVAGEAGVPFYSISGSDFVEMFVGVGASRVRDLFDQAKENAPAIVFIDEIDAVGRHRGAGMGGGHDEREQTLNQLLVEMDGFDVRGGVILIAATNRPDVLDPALLRPGRFDRQIAVEAPDLKGRSAILRVHAQGKPIGADVDLETVARRTPGFTGADLANVLNEAALLTARSDGRVITNANLDEAIDRVIMGPQKRTRIMNRREMLITAYHEGGHALVAAAMPGTDPVQKVTILPRGRALGYAQVMPDQDKYSSTRSEMLDSLAYMLGGRAAEELIFHDPTTGAGNDIEKATKLARAMVTQYGMTERLGAVKLGSDGSEPFLGREMGSGGGQGYSEETAAIIDEEVSALINNAHQEAYDVLNENREVLDTLVRNLFEKETLDRAAVDAIFADLTRWPERAPWTGSDTRVPSDIPPVEPPPAPPEPEPVGVGASLPPGHRPHGAGLPAPAPGHGPNQPGPWQPGWNPGPPGGHNGLPGPHGGEPGPGHGPGYGPNSPGYGPSGPGSHGPEGGNGRPPSD